MALSPLKALRVYRDEIGLHRDRLTGLATWADLIRDYPMWQSSLPGRTNPISIRRPWMTFGATRFLRGQLHAGSRVFEYGSGGSSLFFLDRGCEVISVEHDEAWAQTVTSRVDGSNASRWKLHAAPPRAGVVVTDSLENDFTSTSEEYAGLSFQDYVTSIDPYPDNHFDLVVVDGRARPACCARARRKVKPGGFLLLDNSEREIYSAAFTLLRGEGWPEQNFFGPGPCNGYFWQTTIWRKPSP